MIVKNKGWSLKKGTIAIVVLICICIFGKGYIIVKAQNGEDYGTVVESGKCGATEIDNLIWTVYEKDSNYTLVISGTGAMRAYSCPHAAPWSQYPNSRLIIQKGITEIGAYAFAENWELEGNLIIPTGVRKVGQRAFLDCSELTGNLTIPSSVITIEDAAFAGCRGLTGDLIIPSSVTQIGDAAFSGCTGLDGTLTIQSGMTRIGGLAFLDCRNLKGNLIIPDGITEIDSDTFYGCSGFTGKLVIPESVKVIGSGAFERCSGLTGKLVIPSGVTEIWDWAFKGCSRLTGNVVLQENVRVVNQEAFYGTDGIKEITIYNKNCEIGIGAFAKEKEVSSGHYQYIEGGKIIYGYTNSTAQKYASIYGIEFRKCDKEANIKNLKNANISLSQTSYKFNGNKQTPSVKVTYDGKKLTSGSDYAVTYKNNRYVGTAEVQIKGTGSYTGTVTKKFKIVSPGSVTIKFDKNTKSSAAKVSKSSIKVSRGMQYGKLPTATLKGYKFAGWYTGKKNGKKIESKSYVENNPAKTLYAGWKRVTYKIQYNCDGGKNVKANPASYTIASKKITLQEPSRTGYIFAGWYNAKGKKVSAIPAGSTGDITLKAKWTPIKYKVSFKNSNIRFEKAMSDMTMIYGKKYTLPKNSYKSQNKNMVFVGWNTRKDGKGTAFQNQEKVWNLTAKNNGTVILYAQFANKNICYSIRYNLDGGNWSGTKGKTSYTCTDKKYILPKPVKTGYTFVGWKDAEGNVVTNMPQSSIGNKRFTAKWKANEYTIKYNVNGGTGSLKDMKCVYDRTCTISSCPFEKKNCKFINWNTMADGTGTAYQAGQQTQNVGTSGIITLYAQWKTINRIEDIQFTGRNLILNPSNADPYNYTNSDEVADKLTDIFRGNTGLTTADKKMVNVALGTSNVPDNGVMLYACNRTNSGTSCWIYAHSVYYTLYGEAIGVGGGPYNRSYIVPGVHGIRNLNYEILNGAGVRKTVGAYIRTDTHSMILLGYNKTGIAILEGNADGAGLVRISNYSWSAFNSAIMKNGKKYINFIIQPK